MLTTITRRLEWDAAHRVLRHESKCATLHGHRYVALIEMSGPLDTCARVVDFGVVRERVGAWIDDHWDHTTLVNLADRDLYEFCYQQVGKGHQREPYPFLGEPTAENIAAVLLSKSVELLADTGVTVVSVEVFETPNCSAKVFA